MLYDPKWEVETKADPFDLRAMVAWLKNKPANKTYNYMNCSGGCLLDCYLSAMKCNDDPMAYTNLYSLRPEWQDKIAFPTPWTYGAALARARALL